MVAARLPEIFYVKSLGIVSELDRGNACPGDLGFKLSAILRAGDIQARLLMT
jgi:hypothetical protein